MAFTATVPGRLQFLRVGVEKGEGWEPIPEKLKRTKEKKQQ